MKKIFLVLGLILILTASSSYLPAGQAGADWEQANYDWEKVDGSVGVYLSTSDPAVTDDGYPVGTKWINTSAVLSVVWELYDNSSGAAVWATEWVCPSRELDYPVVENIVLDNSPKYDTEILYIYGATVGSSTPTVTFNIEECAAQSCASVADVLSSDIVADADGQDACSSACDVNTITNQYIDAGDRMRIAISATNGTVEQFLLQYCERWVAR